MLDSILMELSQVFSFKNNVQRVVPTAKEIIKLTINNLSCHKQQSHNNAQDLLANKCLTI